MSANASTAIGTITNMATLLAIVVVPTIIAVRKRYQRTIGSRRKLAEQVDKLSCNVQTTYIDTLFGTPLFIRTRGEVTERVYLSPHAYIQVVVDDSESVVWWAVTTQDKRFKPRFFLPPMSLDDNGRSVQLNRSKLAELNAIPESASWDFRARRFSVVESYYFGNPGAYQTYLIGYNDAGVGDIGFGELLHQPLSGYGYLLIPPEDGTPRDALTSDEYMSTFNVVRGGTVVNTFGVVRPWLGDAEAELLQLWGLGPDLDHVRVLTSTAARLPSWWRINRNPLFPRRMRREWRRMRREVQSPTNQ